MSEIKVNDYVVCRYKGESGDVIAGQVLKIRAGKAFLKNLLTGTESKRAVDIVNRRNIVVPRAVALGVAEIFHETDDKQKARKAAVKAAETVKAAEAKTDKVKPDEKLNKEQPETKAKTVKAAKVTKRALFKSQKLDKRTKAYKNSKAKVGKNGVATTFHVQISQGGTMVLDKYYPIKV